MEVQLNDSRLMLRLIDSRGRGVLAHCVYVYEVATCNVE